MEHAPTSGVQQVRRRYAEPGGLGAILEIARRGLADHVFNALPTIKAYMPADKASVTLAIQSKPALNIAPKPLGGIESLARVAAALAIFLVLSGCSREDATARLKSDLPVDIIEIIHARFPCRSPELHFFGYRFRAGSKAELSEGDICWNFSTRQWSWRFLPGQSLSRLNAHD